MHVVKTNSFEALLTEVDDPKTLFAMAPRYRVDYAETAEDSAEFEVWVQFTAVLDHKDYGERYLIEYREMTGELIEKDSSRDTTAGRDKAFDMVARYKQVLEERAIQPQIGKIESY